MRKILIIDGNVEIRKQMSSLFTDTERFSVVEATNGVEAYQKSSRQEFDLVITDYEIARLKGLELVTAIRENIDNSETPIIFYSTDVEQVTEECKDQELIYFLNKPIKDSTLIEFVENTIIEGLSKKLDFNVDVEIINPFIESTIGILKTNCSLSKVEQCSPKSIFKDVDTDVVGCIAIVSKYYTGKLSICFKKDVFLKIASKLSNLEVNELNDETNDIAGEFINLVYDKANIIIKKKKFRLEKAIPTIIEARDFHIVNSKYQKNIGIEISTELGNLSIIINIHKGKT
jgi:two-component system chemotaxis response regulator CheY